MGTQQRFTVRATAEQLTKIDAKAQRAGMSRTKFVVQCAVAGGRPMGRSDPVRIIALLELIRQLLNEIAVGLGRRECLDATLLLSALTLVEERLSEAGAAIARQRK